MLNPSTLETPDGIHIINEELDRFPEGHEQSALELVKHFTVGECGDYIVVNYIDFMGHLGNPKRSELLPPPPPPTDPPVCSCLRDCNFDQNRVVAGRFTDASMAAVLTDEKYLNDAALIKLNFISPAGVTTKNIPGWFFETPCYDDSHNHDLDVSHQVPSSARHNSFFTLRVLRTSTHYIPPAGTQVLFSFDEISSWSNHVTLRYTVVIDRVNDVTTDFSYLTEWDASIYGNLIKCSVIASNLTKLNATNNVNTSVTTVAFSNTMGTTVGANGNSGNGNNVSFTNSYTFSFSNTSTVTQQLQYISQVEIPIGDADFYYCDDNESNYYEVTNHATCEEEKVFFDGKDHSTGSFIVKATIDIQ